MGRRHPDRRKKYKRYVLPGVSFSQKCLHFFTVNVDLHIVYGQYHYRNVFCFHSAAPIVSVQIIPAVI